MSPVHTISSLRSTGWTACSPEADVAADAYEQVAGTLPDRLRVCTSGRELIDRDFGDDVEIATEVNRSRVVPLLLKEAFVDATSRVLDTEPS